ncbi:MAG: hypothetical protein WCJ71_05780 [Candidatus Omnitrophota bacterium]
MSWMLSNPYSSFQSANEEIFFERSQCLAWAKKEVIKEGFGAVRLINYTTSTKYNTKTLEYIVTCVGVDLYNLIQFQTPIDPETMKVWQKKGVEW